MSDRLDVCGSRRAQLAEQLVRQHGEPLVQSALGLVAKSTAPTSSAATVTSAPRWVSDDAITTGIGRRRIRSLMNGMPSIRGISTSSVSTSGYERFGTRCRRMRAVPPSKALLVFISKRGPHDKSPDLDPQLRHRHAEEARCPQIRRVLASWHVNSFTKLRSLPFEHPCYTASAVAESKGDTTVREESAVDQHTRALTLEWVWPSAATKPLRGARLLIGRDEAADIRVEGGKASRRHAELYRQGPLYVLRDLGSTNGTWLGGKRIEHAPVAPGAVVRVGDWVGVVTERALESPTFSEVLPDLFGGALLHERLAPLRRAASATLPVLLVGKTGTGKERVARALHALSGRRGHFIAVNCASIPEQLAEAELFGYRRGAFTGAQLPSTGHFRAASGGTLFLDELPELPLTVQAKLLRALDDGQVLGLGESTPVRADVRVVSASQRPLRALVEEGRVRQDLAARLTGLELRLPMLSERHSDVPSLFSRFLRELSGGRPPRVDARLVECLCLHEWPENVRELELVTRRLLAVHGHEEVLTRRHLPRELSDLNADDSPRRAQAEPSDRREYELARLKTLLADNGGNVKAAAETLGVSRQRVYRLLGDAAASPVGESNGVKHGQRR